MDVLSYGRQWVDEEDIIAVVKVLRGDWLTQGSVVKEFESCIARYCGVAHAVSFSSGTAALHASVLASGVKAGDEIITSPLSFVASANCGVYAGAVPRFADIEPEGFNINPDAVKEIFTDRTRVVIPVDYSGHPAEMDEIVSIAHKRGSLVIEDSCHSLGADYRGKKVGGLADMTVFSFHPVKPITTGEGGMVMTNDPLLYEKLLRVRSHGIARPQNEVRPWYYEMVELGFNYRLTDIQCALGLSQMAKLDFFVKRRRGISKRYDEAFKGLSNVRTFVEKDYVQSSRHLYVLSIDFSALGKTRADVMSELHVLGVGSQVHYQPIHLHPFYRDRFGCRPGDFPHAERFYEKALSLPLYPKLTDDEVLRVVRAVQRVLS